MGQSDSLYTLLLSHARDNPENLAILAPGRDPLTYRDLLEQIDRALGVLRSLGIRRQDRVAVVLPNGPEMAVAMASVSAGAVCAPLNPAFKMEEWFSHFAKLRVDALLTAPGIESACRHVTLELGLPIIEMVAALDARAGTFELSGTALRDAVADGVSGAADDAFLLPTSGTTAEPKAVPLTHANICASARNAATTLRLGPEDRLLGVLPLHHAHGLISGLFSSLAAGSSVVCTPGFDAAKFFDWLTAYRPTWYTAVPAIHRAVLEQAGRQDGPVGDHVLRLVRSASAPLPAQTLEEIESLFGVPLIETYGMTEAASQIASNPLPPLPRKVGSSGLAAGPEVAVFDESGNAMQAGRAGEIVLRGRNVTRGYDADPAANEAAFSNGWLRTGDLGYLDEDGYLFLVGRTSEIINRGGQKVAPREVEDVLLTCPDVAQAVVFAVPHERLGEDVAAAAVLHPDATATDREIRSFVTARLASYKVPARVHLVARIPTNTMGKVQRSEMARLLGVDRPQAAPPHVDPRTELERQVSETWADVLRRDRIGVLDNFFDLGGDSLAAALVISRLRERYGRALTYSDLFRNPTAAETARLLSQQQAATDIGSLAQTSQSGDQGPIDLSYSQERLYVLSNLDPSGHTYHVLEIARLRGPLDQAALSRSIAAIVTRNEILTATFAERAGRPSQSFQPEIAERFELQEIELREGEDPIDGLHRVAREAHRRPFDLARGPQLRATLLTLGDDDHALIVVVHHLVTDGWSQRLFWQQLETAYAAEIAGAPISQPPGALQYRDYVAWQKVWLGTADATEQLTYWRGKLDGLTTIDLPTDHIRPSRWSGKGARVPIRISRALATELMDLSRSGGVTLFMTLLGAFQTLLYRYTGSTDIAVGSLIASRTRVDLESMMGAIVNTVVLRSDFSNQPSFTEVLQRVRDVTLEAYRHQDLPFERVLQSRQIPRQADRSGPIQTMFVLQNATSQPPRLDGAASEFIDIDPGTARFDLLLELMVRDGDGGLSGWFEYSTDLFDRPTIERLSAHFENLLQAVADDPQQAVSRVSFLTGQERQDLRLVRQ
nr:condensation domain-containing protein [Alphaproteobacteria bacterium]